MGTTGPQRNNSSGSNSPNSPHTSTSSTSVSRQTGNTAPNAAEGMPLVTFKMRGNGIYFFFLRYKKKLLLGVLVLSGWRDSVGLLF